MAKLVCLIPVIGGIAIASAGVCCSCQSGDRGGGGGGAAWQHHSTAESARAPITNTDDSRKRTVRRVVLRCRSGRHRHCPPRSVQRSRLLHSPAPSPPDALSLVLSPLLYVIPWPLCRADFAVGYCSQPRLPTSLGLRGGENKKVMAGSLRGGRRRRRQRVRDHHPLGHLMLIPAVFISGEYQIRLVQEDVERGRTRLGQGLRYNTIMSGLTFYLYNELHHGACRLGVSHSVANTAKRAVVIVGSAIAFGEEMGFMKSLGCSIAIGGTFLYAIADDIPKMLGMGDKKTK